MSMDNFIVCMDCGEWLVLGKYSRFHDDTINKTLYGFAFISDGHEDNCKGDSDSSSKAMHLSWRYLQHFLMRHRGHELRVLPIKLIGPYENDFFPQYAPGDHYGNDNLPEESYYLSPTGIPDQIEDARLAPEKVVRRLQEMSRGENLMKPVWDSEDYPKEEDNE